MNISYKEYIPIFDTNSKLDKHGVMMKCYNEFNTVVTNDLVDNDKLNGLSKLLKRNIVYSNVIWDNNHRSKANVNLTNIDILIFDIDECLTIEQVHNMCDFTIMTLTTTSHTKEHNKFRVIIPLAEKVSFTDDIEYKEFLNIINNKYFNRAVDKACLESARAYITTNNAYSRLNNIKVRLNPKEILEQAKINTFSTRLRNIDLITKPKSKNIVTIKQVKNYSKVLALVSEFRKGNHHSPTYKIIGIGKIAGLSNEDCANLIMSYNLGKEYNNFDLLVKKAKTYDK